MPIRVTLKSAWREVGLGIGLFIPFFFGAGALESALLAAGFSFPSTPLPSLGKEMRSHFNRLMNMCGERNPRSSVAGSIRAQRAERKEKEGLMRSSSWKGIPVWGLIGLLPFLWGCSVIPPEAREEADLSVAFPELQQDPDFYLGRTVLLAGMITKVERLDDQTELELLQRPLRREDVPIGTMPSEGRFVISHSGGLDPAIYRSGRYVTVMGQVIGSRMVRVGETEDRAPIINSELLRPWSQFQQDYYNAYYHPRDYPSYPYHPRYGDFYFDWFLNTPYRF
jgi:outer membrane lipoprotein